MLVGVELAIWMASSRMAALPEPLSLMPGTFGDRVQVGAHLDDPLALAGQISEDVGLSCGPPTSVSVTMCTVDEADRSGPRPIWKLVTPMTGMLTPGPPSVAEDHRPSGLRRCPR